MSVEVQLEWRSCRRCQARFKAMKTSKQSFCSIACDAWGAGALKSRPKRGEKEAGSVTVRDIAKTRPSGRVSFSDLGFADLKIQRKNLEDRKKNMQKLEIKNESERRSGSPRTGTGSTSTDESTTEGAETRSSETSTRAEGVATRLTESSPQYESLREATSRSMSLIDESVVQLRELMRKTANVDNQDELPISQIERVKAACGCAHQIYQLLKVKVDAIKAINELGKN